MSEINYLKIKGVSYDFSDKTARNDIEALKNKINSIEETLSNLDAELSLI